MSAKEEACKLHGTVGKLLNELAENGRTDTEFRDGDPVLVKRQASAADIGQMIAFIKLNGVSALPVEGNNLGRLAKNVRLRLSGQPLPPLDEEGDERATGT